MNTTITLEPSLVIRESVKRLTKNIFEPIVLYKV